MYQNLNVAVLKMIMETPPTYECFKDIMIDKFMENRYQFDKYIESIKKYDKHTITSRMYGMSCKCNLDDLKNKMSFVYNTYIDQYNKRIETILKKVNETLENQESNTDSSKEEIKKTEIEVKNTPKKKYQRKCPKDMAKKYDVGFEKLGLSGDLYVVKQNKKGIKKWIKKK